MDKRYLISVDQSTQGTKALLFDEYGTLISRSDLPHEQMINDLGWVSHNPTEIYNNTVSVIKELIEKNHIEKSMIAGLGISNQRETTVIWDKATGEPLANAIVWQCARATEICEREAIATHADEIAKKTGLRLSPYFPAAKMAWLVENVEDGRKKSENQEIALGTIDAWLVFKLTGGESFKTDYSNASRTQLFNIHTLEWDKQICEWFQLDIHNLPQVCNSDDLFGYTDLDGFLDTPIPIHSAMGDSHAALFGQGCLKPGMIKTTYGTGSSIMMNIGTEPVLSEHGVVTSLAWGRSGKVEYVLEGNLNYTGAVITWLKDDMKIINSPVETGKLAEQARKNDGLYLIPAFTGLGAPYWNSKARAAVIGMDRTTGKSEFVRAALECIAYQITDVVRAMEEDSKIKVAQLRVDGGPTRNDYLMHFQSDILSAEVLVPDAEELSGIGAAYMAGIAMGLWDESVFEKMNRKTYSPSMEENIREEKYSGWKNAISKVL